MMTWDSHIGRLARSGSNQLIEGERGRLAMVIAAYERGSEADAEQLAAALPPAPTPAVIRSVAFLVLTWPVLMFAGLEGPATAGSGQVGAGLFL